MVFIKVAFKGIAAVKEKKGNFIDKFCYWRKSCIKTVMLGMFIVCWFELVPALKAAANWRQKLNQMPLALQDKLELFIMANVAAETFVVLCVVIAMFFLSRALSTTRKDYEKSTQYIAKAWIAFFFVPFALYLCIPFVYFFRNDLLDRDICTVTLVSLMHLGPVFRQGFQRAAVKYPKLAAVAYYPPPPPDTSMKYLHIWAGGKWCTDNKGGKGGSWQEKMFSTKWLRLSRMAIGTPDEMTLERVDKLPRGMPGVIPGAVAEANMMYGVPVMMGRGQGVEYQCAAQRQKLSWKKVPHL
jgi:hypothetical protein